MAKEAAGTRGRARGGQAGPSENKAGTGEKQQWVDVWSGYVSPGGIIASAVYLIALSGLLIYAIFQFWPGPVSQKEAAEAVRFFDARISMSAELRLLAVVALAGALGGQIHTLRSFAWYVGNRQLKLSWLMRYLLTPLVGAGLALVFYFVLRAGFISTDSSVADNNVYGFAGLAGLVGLFSNMAVNKLQRMAKELLGPDPAEGGLDAVPQKSEGS
ncbi:MAG: hypothetical protein ACYTEK_19735 [Planctomycetota bacterium]|jgi:hypothetical protein